MPAFAPQHFCWMKRPAPKGFFTVVCLVLIAGIAVSGLGCDGGGKLSEAEAEAASDHAQSRSQYLADAVVMEARDWVLLHPDSDRQRQSRRLKLELESARRGGGDASDRDDNDAGGGDNPPESTSEE